MITRRMDEQGRICLPKRFREALELEPDMLLSVELSKHSIIITNNRPKCIICDIETDNIYKDMFICKSCEAKLKRQ